MIKIIKSNKEPEVLSEFRNQIKRRNGVITSKDYCSFQSLPEFKELQIALLKEQRYICCYCMAQIDQTKMVVEHFKCREKYGMYSLTYSNMLASCRGCINGNKASIHCDKKKENQELKKLPNPADKEHNIGQIISYSTIGEIVLLDNRLKEKEKTDFLVDINYTLNLNNEELKKARTDAAVYFIQQCGKTGKMPRVGDSDRLLAFWGFTQFILQKRSNL